MSIHFLIQILDQIDTFGKTYLDKLDSRLALHDSRLASIEENVKNIQERAHVWDTFQHHATSWADLMTSVDSKVDHISRYDFVFIYHANQIFFKF